MFTDTYLSSFSLEVLEDFCASYANVIGPYQGRAAVPEGVDQEGNILIAQEAIGDPDCFYACIRAEGTLALPEGVLPCDMGTGAAILGSWA